MSVLVLHEKYLNFAYTTPRRANNIQSVENAIQIKSEMRVGPKFSKLHNSIPTSSLGDIFS